MGNSLEHLRWTDARYLSYLYSFCLSLCLSIKTIKSKSIGQPDATAFYCVRSQAFGSGCRTKLFRTSS